MCFLPRCCCAQLQCIKCCLAYKSLQLCKAFFQLCARLAFKCGLGAGLAAAAQVENVELPFDKAKNQRRQFAFVTFEREDSVELVCREPKQKIGNKECDIKKATPKPDARGMRGGWGGGFGAAGGRGGRGGGRGGRGRGGGKAAQFCLVPAGYLLHFWGVGCFGLGEAVQGSDRDVFDSLQAIRTKAGATRATAVAAMAAAATAKVMVAAMARATVVAMVTTTMAVAMAEATTTPGGTMAATRGVTEVDTANNRVTTTRRAAVGAVALVVEATTPTVVKGEHVKRDDWTPLCRLITTLIFHATTR